MIDKTVDIRIKIVNGTKHKLFRKNEELAFLKSKFGNKIGKNYFDGFMYNKVFTLEIKNSRELVGSALLTVLGGTLQITELVIDKKYRNKEIFSDVFNSIGSWASKKQIHKIWLIDNPGLGRINLYKKLGYFIEVKMKNNILREDEYLVSCFLDNYKKGKKYGKIITSIKPENKHSDWRKKQHLKFITDLFGSKKGKSYYLGFTRKKELTLEIIHKNTLIGSAAVEVNDGLFRIEGFVLKNKYRGQGIGTKALLQMEKTAKKLGCHKMWLITNPCLRVINLYKRLGWKTECILKRNVAQLDELLMCKFI